MVLFLCASTPRVGIIGHLRLLHATTRLHADVQCFAIFLHLHNSRFDTINARKLGIIRVRTGGETSGALCPIPVRAPRMSVA
jgi:hypothetical protein